MDFNLFWSWLTVYISNEFAETLLREMQKKSPEIQNEIAAIKETRRLLKLKTTLLKLFFFIIPKSFLLFFR